MQLLALQEVEAGLEGELQGRVIVLVVSRCVALALGSLSGKLEAFGREGLKLLWGEGVADVGEGVGQVNQLAGRVKAKLVWNVLLGEEGNVRVGAERAAVLVALALIAVIVHVVCLDHALKLGNPGHREVAVVPRHSKDAAWLEDAGNLLEGSVVVDPMPCLQANGQINTALWDGFQLLCRCSQECGLRIAGSARGVGAGAGAGRRKGGLALVQHALVRLCDIDMGNRWLLGQEQGPAPCACAYVHDREVAETRGGSLLAATAALCNLGENGVPHFPGIVWSQLVVLIGKLTKDAFAIGHGALLLAGPALAKLVLVRCSWAGVQCSCREVLLPQHARCCACES